MALLLTSVISAQSDFGSITGFVKDPSGAAVPRAKVLIHNEATGQEHAASANDAGYYVVPALQPGLYAVAVEVGGFKEFETTHVKLDPNSSVAVNVPLVVGGSTETVVVSASAAVLQADSAVVQREISGTQIQAQELNGRNPIS